MSSKRKSAVNSHTARDRWLVASRVAAAVLGGYALTSAATLVVAQLLPLPRAQAVLAATMLSFAVYAAVVLWTFHAPSLKRLWSVIILGTALFCAISWGLEAGGVA